VSASWGGLSAEAKTIAAAYSSISWSTCPIQAESRLVAATATPWAAASVALVAVAPVATARAIPKTPAVTSASASRPSNHRETAGARSRLGRRSATPPVVAMRVTTY
jgi:hypothetical protein